MDAFHSVVPIPSSVPLAPLTPAPPILTVEEQKAPQAVGPHPYEVQMGTTLKST